jgi:radical SAM superfamily enzyme YgiQ (UPF0313 family)
MIEEIISVIKRIGIDLTIYLMIGFPSETDKDIKETIKFAKKLDAKYYSLSILAPYPGTEIYDNLIHNGVKLPKEHWEYFFHQSKDMILTFNINKKLIQQCLSLNDKNGRSRL